ncbi:MAG: cupin domain-containing protein [Sphingobacterium sp.]|uniref:cupin domain-containing protein n=1 Tax=Sphingobacterium sp. JB170 TaxID=1434842 RepID=UPI00097F1395|nr:cupin domain-containing protein [Sphingobacterium sp. JB170]SJN31148.1 Putative pectin degradation protein [Sphingobacterium sp. JB170]
MNELFGTDAVKQWVDLGKGVFRKVLVHNQDLMLVSVKFESGAIGEVHQHPHVQTSYVQSGKFLYTIGDKQQLLNSGDGCIVPTNAWHGCECLEKGVLIDSFTPRRDDFL